MKRLVFNKLAKLFNMNPYFFKKTIINFTNDFKNEKRTTFKEKIWAYRRGFTSSKIIEYGINETNYRDYLSEVTYYRLFPLNENYSFWIDDKVTVKYVLSRYNEHLPAYYFYIDKGRAIPSVDTQYLKEYSSDSVISLLKDQKTLAFKQEAGSLGAGFYKIEYHDDKYLVNNKQYTESQLISFIENLDGYLITEFLKAHKEIDKIYPNVANSLRLMVVKDEMSEPVIANGFIRFGTDETKGIDNASAGGIFSIVDVNTGTFKTGHRVTNQVLTDYDVHPNTGVPLQGGIPHWELIKEKVIEITKYLNHLSWMGFDVVITDKGFKILEINSHQDINWYQYYYPLLKDNPASDFLNKKIKEKIVRH